MNKTTHEKDLYVFFFSIGKFPKCTKTLMLMAIVNRPAPQTVMLMYSANECAWADFANVPHGLRFHFIIQMLVTRS